MPGALGTAETDFAPQLCPDAGLATKHNVISLDPRGYGRSRPPVRDFPVDFYARDAEDAAAVMAELGHKRYHVIGWSDGAISAVIHAAQHADKVERLVIFGGNAFFGPDDIEAFEATRDVEATWSERMKATHEPVYGKDLQPMWSGACDAWKRILEERGGNICVDEAKGLSCKTLVAHGEKDPLCLRKHADWFVENIPDAQLEIFPEGKHNLHLRYAKEFNEVVLKFLGDAE
jgi:valacyclovir hydrolase